jgi:SAM-dependent methyltransferase
LALADGHERAGELYPGWRDWLVAQLGLRPGQIVLDVGCGGGANFAALRARVGPCGRIVGIEHSPELRSVATDRVAQRRWTNIQLVDDPVELGRIGADAALFCGAHDLLQNKLALRGILTALRPGARVVAGGGKWPAAWLGPMLRHYVTLIHRRHVADFTGFDQPWRQLAEHIKDLRVHHVGLGTGYLAHGHAPAAPHPSFSN